jgi:signal transduction histidine kinase
MEIIVEDDGIGMENQNNGDDPGDFGFRGGLGLFGIRERLDYFGAGIKIESEAGAGTKISITIPSYCVKTPERTRN